jgi:Tol biopolymer transport system component
MKVFLFIIYALLLMSIFSANACPQSDLAKPRMFAPGIISTPDDELNAAFTPDGKSLYFSKDAERKAIIVVSHLVNGKWSTPEVASFSGRYSDVDPYFSADGKQLFFISNRPLFEGDKPKGDYDIWVVERTTDGWSKPKNLGAPVNTGADEFYPAIAADGTLYFSTIRDGGKGRFDIYRSHLIDGKYTEPENLGGLNSSSSEVDCYIAPDQSYMIIASYGRPAGIGDGDLYVSFNRNGFWTKAVNLGAGVNSTAREFTPIGSPDGKYLFFTSERGFQDSVPSKPYSYSEFRKHLRSNENGKGNIYQIEISALNLAQLKLKAESP